VSVKNYIPVKPGEAKFNSGFWSKRVENYMPIIYAMESTLLDETNAARLLNFGIAAGEIEGKFHENAWSDGDCYKFIQGCSYQYAVTKDKEILDLLNKYIPWIEASQEDDGYICTQITLTDKERWAHPANHELYNFGHLFTAAVVNYEATNDERLLNVAKKAADYLCTVFIPLNKDLGDFGFNPSQIMGLIDLYRVTNKKEYLELADIFVTMRGTKLGNGDQNQNRVPLREEFKPVGHAVTGAYLYAGAAEIYSFTKEEALINSVEKIWNELTSRRIYITGGVCPTYVGISERGDNVEESFGDEYNLPHRIAYNETCANIAVAMWALRMYNITGKSTYGDWMETILFNAGISGGSLDMTEYFYANPLAHRKDDHIKPTFAQYKHVPNKRFKTFSCWCCPPQLWRTFTGLPSWIYSLTNDSVSINLFAGCELNTTLPDGSPIHINMETNYPWDETVSIKVLDAPKEGIDLRLRIPNWCAKATVNDNPTQSGVHTIKVNANDTITINLPMEVKLYQSNPMIEQANGMLAVKRGPVVYCLEGCDIEGNVKIDELVLPVDAKFKEETIKDLPYDMIGLRTELLHKTIGEEIYHPVTLPEDTKIPVRFIPYFSWANRGENDMSVWLPKA